VRLYMVTRLICAVIIVCTHYDMIYIDI